MSTSINLNNSRNLEKSSDVKERLQKMEDLEKKLKIQLYICAFAVFLTIAVYFLIWYCSECWALPFQESPCKQPRDLPLMATDQNTLADAVDEFVFALQTQISIIHDVVEMPFRDKRLLQFSLTKNNIGQLLSQHSADLVAFGALKREDERLEELELAIGFSDMMLILPFCYLFLIFFIIRKHALIIYMHPGQQNNIIMSAEEKENSQNARLKQLKRRIPFLYIATFVCIAAELTLFFIVVAGQYHSGSSPVFINVRCNETSNGQVQKNCDLILSFSDYHSFLATLNATLQKSCVGIKNSLSSLVLETRQMALHYESETITTAIEQYLSLKQYNVDRRIMPRKIDNDSEVDPEDEY
ncbi:hypothetical protein Ddc_13935 [Ditylenchus destructor]|nr:hypothetical protein Ddc_13935 [Ditylenchus destructor]